jgi:hypothetical protein
MCKLSAIIRSTFLTSAQTTRGELLTPASGMHWSRSPPTFIVWMMFTAGPYYGKRAGRARMGDREMVVGEVRQEKWGEAGFDQEASHFHHRMDAMMNVSCSFFIDY